MVTHRTHSYTHRLKRIVTRPAALLHTYTAPTTTTTKLTNKSKKKQKQIYRRIYIEHQQQSNIEYYKQGDSKTYEYQIPKSKPPKSYQRITKSIAK